MASDLPDRVSSLELSGKPASRRKSAHPAVILCGHQGVIRSKDTLDPLDRRSKVFTAPEKWIQAFSFYKKQNSGKKIQGSQNWNDTLLDSQSHKAGGKHSKHRVWCLYGPTIFSIAPIAFIFGVDKL